MNQNPDTRGLRPRWEKGGPSPNPAGRPKRLPISDALAERALQPVPTSIRQKLERDGVILAADATCADAVAAQTFLQAMSGDVTAAKEIRESIEGKAGYRIEPRDAVDTLVRIQIVESKAPILNPHAGTIPRNSIMGKGAAETPAPPSPKAPERGA